MFDCGCVVVLAYCFAVILLWCCDVVCWCVAVLSSCCFVV